jgi:hypothetical protein
MPGRFCASFPPGKRDPAIEASLDVMQGAGERRTTGFEVMVVEEILADELDPHLPSRLPGKAHVHRHIGIDRLLKSGQTADESAHQIEIDVACQIERGVGVQLLARALPFSSL